MMTTWVRAGFAMAMAAYVGWGVINAIRTGVFNAAGTHYSRRKAPLRYWALVGGWSVFIPLLLVAVAVREFGPKALG